MRRWLRSHLTYANIISTVALFLVLGGGTSLAMNGGNFILGEPNSAGNPTQLSSPTTNAAGALKVTSTATSGGRAIQGTSAHGQGVYGHSGSNAGVVGDSDAFDGVFGVSHGSGAGVSGHNNTGGGFGVFGQATGGWAIGAAGNATQARASGGFVKAMAYVLPNSVPHIQRCFNSQLPPSQATSGNCGITYSESASTPGIYYLTFNFQVSDRFISATGSDFDRTVNAFVGQPTPNRLTVNSFVGSGTSADSAFFIFVY